TSECSPYGDKGPDATKPGHPQTVRGLPILPNTTFDADLSLDRMDTRRGLLQQYDEKLRQVEGSPAVDGYNRLQQRAFDLLTSSKLKACFDLRSEDPRLLDAYGRTLFGNSTLIGRRLIEAGVRFVNVTWDLYWDRVKVDYDAWDTHTRNFPI